MAINLEDKSKILHLGNLGTRTVALVDAALVGVANTYLSKSAASETYLTKTEAANKVDKENGKVLSSNDYTTAEKTKLANISEGAQANVIESVKVNGTALSVANKAVNIDISGKVDKVTGKDLSSNDYTTAEKTKLANISEGAQVNVIESVKVNGTALSVANKAVNIELPESVDISGKMDKVPGATVGNIAVFDSDGGVIDSELNMQNVLTQVRYGYKIKKNESDPYARVEYLYDAVGFTPASMNFSTGIFNYGSWRDVWFVKGNKPLMLRNDGTVDYYLDPNDYTKKADGTPSDVANPNYEGNAMCQIPLVWVYRYEDDDYLYEIVSNVQWDENYKAYAHTRANGTIANYFYHALFNGTGDATKIRSLAGRTPFKTLTAQQIFDAAKANGSKWGVESWSQRTLIQILLILISKSTNTRVAFGAGRHRQYLGTNSYGNPATTGNLKSSGQFFGWAHTGNSTGAPSGFAQRQVKVFHIESFWAEQWKVTAGLLCKNGELHVKLTPENGGYSLTDTTGYLQTGFTYGSKYLSGETASGTASIINMHGGDYGMVPYDFDTGITGSMTTSNTYYCGAAASFPKESYVDSDTLLANPDTPLVTTCLHAGGDCFAWNMNPSAFSMTFAFGASYASGTGSESNINTNNCLICCEG